MPLQGEYAEPLPGWQADQIAEILRTGDTRSVDVMGLPVVLYTMRGAKSGLLRRVPLMRVEHEGSYAAVASKGGAPKHPVWYHSIVAHPHVTIQDGTQTRDYLAREAVGHERDTWWEMCVRAFPPYGEYQATATASTGRLIPVFICEPAPDTVA